MEIQTEPICTFDPNVNSNEQIPQNEEIQNEPNTTSALDIYSPTKQVYRSSNPFDVNYVPTGMEDEEPSPEKEVIQTSVIQKTTVYTTSRSLEKKHEEYIRNALAPIDPDFHQQLQEKLERDSPSDKKAQDGEKSYHSEEIQQFETEAVNQQENNQGIKSNNNQGNTNPTPALGQSNILSGLVNSDLTKLSLDAIPNLQETLLNSMKALSSMDPQQQNELLATITVLQGNHPSQAPKVFSNENSMKEPFRNRPQPNPVQRFNQVKQPIRPNFHNQNNHIINHAGNAGAGRFAQNKENFRRVPEVEVFPSVQKLEEIIEEHQLNAISVLNEFRLKIKKPIDYHIKELVIGRSRLFECICLLNRQTIGQQRAGSKHSAKTEAAKEGLTTLLNSMNSMFGNEKTALVSVLQRMSGKQLLPNPKPIFTNKFAYGNNNNRNGPPHWQARSADGSRGFNNFEDNQDNSNQQYEDKINIGGNVFERVEVENGEFAEGIEEEKAENSNNIEHNENTENIEMEYDERTNEKTKEITISQPIQEVGVHLENEKDVTDSNVKRSYFETCLEDQYFEDLKNDNEFSKENIQNLNKAFEQYLLTHIEKCQQNQFVMQTFREIFNKIVEFISTAFAEGKAEELAEGETHFTEYIERYNLVPVGSFALECMRTDEPVLDSLFIFQEKKETNETEFLELLRCTLDCAQDKIQETKSFGLKFNFKVQTQNERTFLEIEEEKQGKDLKMRIYLLNTTQITKQESHSLYLDKYDFSVLHATRMFKCFEGMEKQYREFRRLLTIFRAWRNGNNLNYLRPEIIDAVLVYNFFNTNSSNLANSIINCIMILNSETILKHILDLNGKIYLDYYNGLSEESKQNLISVCGKTLNCISEQNFSDAKFF